MTRALTWVRRSADGEEAPLPEQRGAVIEYAEQNADDHDMIDLGTHTGKSVLSDVSPDETPIGQHEEVQQKVENIRDGEYDLLIAHHDRCVARDEYFNVLKGVCLRGRCDLVFVEDDRPDSELERDLERIREWNGI